MNNTRILFTNPDIKYVLGFSRLLPQVYTFTIEELFSESIINSFTEDVLRIVDLNIEVEKDKTKFNKEMIADDQIKVMIPYKGNSILFDFQPSTIELNTPRVIIAEITDKHLIISVMNDMDSVNEYKDTLKNIYQYITWINDDLPKIKSFLTKEIEMAVSQRRQTINNTNSILNVI